MNQTDLFEAKTACMEHDYREALVCFEQLMQRMKKGERATGSLKDPNAALMIALSLGIDYARAKVELKDMTRKVALVQSMKACVKEAQEILGAVLAASNTDGANEAKAIIGEEEFDSMIGRVEEVNSFFKKAMTELCETTEE